MYSVGFPLFSYFAAARIVRSTDHPGSTTPRAGNYANQRATRRGENSAGDRTDGALFGARSDCYGA